MSDHSDDMEQYADFMIEYDYIFAEIDDYKTKHHAVLMYCEPYLDQMWTARITGILLGCDFKDVKEHLEDYKVWAEENGVYEI